MVKRFDATKRYGGPVVLASDYDAAIAALRKMIAYAENATGLNHHDEIAISQARNIAFQSTSGAES
jgi:hypothetical protein